MPSEIGYLHHVGHAVRDMQAALELYRRLGFTCATPAYPIISRRQGEPPRPFGAANTHASFARNFVDILTVVTDTSRIPTNARLVPLQVPPSALPQVVDSIERTVAKISASLARFEGMHILVFETADADRSVARFDASGVGHSGVTAVQLPIETARGPHTVPVRVVEVDREDVPEGRLAVAENPDTQALAAQAYLNHPNGALDLVEAILCVPDAQIEQYAERYGRYVGCAARKHGRVQIFELEQSRVTLIPAGVLDTLLPGEKSPPPPALIGYAVAVRDLASTCRLLESNGLPVREAPTGDIFVPGAAALGATVMFRRTGERDRRTLNQ